MNGSLLAYTRARFAGALARYLAEPVSRPAATVDVLALSTLLRSGDVLLTEGNSRAAALVHRVTTLALGACLDVRGRAGSG